MRSMLFAVLFGLGSSVQASWGNYAVTVIPGSAGTTSLDQTSINSIGEVCYLRPGFGSFVFNLQNQMTPVMDETGTIPRYAIDRNRYGEYLYATSSSSSPYSTVVHYYSYSPISGTRYLGYSNSDFTNGSGSGLSVNRITDTGWIGGEYFSWSTGPQGYSSSRFAIFDSSGLEIPSHPNATGTLQALSNTGSYVAHQYHVNGWTPSGTWYSTNPYVMPTFVNGSYLMSTFDARRVVKTSSGIMIFNHDGSTTSMATPSTFFYQFTNSDFASLTKTNGELGIWSPLNGSSSINSLLNSLETGWSVGGAFKMAENGQVIGIAQKGGQKYLVRLDAVPEPATMIFFITGLSGLVMRRKSDRV